MDLPVEIVKSCDNEDGAKHFLLAMSVHGKEKGTVYFDVPKATFDEEERKIVAMQEEETPLIGNYIINEFFRKNGLLE